MPLTSPFSPRRSSRAVAILASSVLVAGLSAGLVGSPAHASRAETGSASPSRAAGRSLAPVAPGASATAVRAAELGRATAATTTTSPALRARVARALATGTPRSHGIAWKACADIDGAQCGMLRVPLDPARPHGATISIALSRVLHTRKPYRGAILTNPGGPGGSGIGLSTLGKYVPHGVGLTYDWYGIDPRGVGSSRPTLSCNGRYFGFDRPDYTPHSPGLFRYWRHKTTGYARACGHAKARRLLAHLHTTDNVADFEAVRRAIGQRKITYYGFSYGTYIGQVYATEHPGRIKAMVLDGVIDPTRVFYRSNLDQDRAFQVTIEKFFAWVAQHHATYHLGATERQVYATYRKQRALVSRHPAGGKLGPDELIDALLPAGYYNLTWLDTAKAFSQLVRHRPAAMIQAYRSGSPSGPGQDNGYAVYLATQCTDAPWPRTFARYRRDNTRVARTAPYETWANGWYNQPCQLWPVRSRRAPVHVSGRHLKAPVLLTAEQYDAATPFPGALKTRSLFPTSRVVEGVGGTSHAVTLYGVSCTDDTIAQLLRSGRLPRRVPGYRADKRCPGLAPPDPSASGRVAAGSHSNRVDARRPASR